MKSLRGGEFEALEVVERGLRFDRHWMVVDAMGRFVTQRQQARMALIDARVDDDSGLLLQGTRECPDLVVRGAQDATLPVVVWRDTVQAAPVGVMRMPGSAVSGDRLPAGGPASRHTAQCGPELRRVATDQVRFADGFPFLLISRASLDDLNARLRSPCRCCAFAPTWWSGLRCHAEDSWRRIPHRRPGFPRMKPLFALHHPDHRSGDGGAAPNRCAP